VSLLLHMGLVLQMVSRITRGRTLVGNQTITIQTCILNVLYNRISSRVTITVWATGTGLKTSLRHSEANSVAHPPTLWLKFYTPRVAASFLRVHGFCGVVCMQLVGPMQQLLIPYVIITLR
jgi:hypothetical protein